MTVRPSSTAPPAWPRRALLGGLAGLPLAARSGAAATPGVPVAPLAPATMLIGGPEGGSLDQWGRILQSPLSRALREAELKPTSVGGPDGVTAANQFAARGEPDGQTALLAPGEAVLAWIVGEPRAKFDVGRWLPVMACVTPGIVLFRPGAVNPRQPARIAVIGFATPDLAALLGLDLLGAVAQPVVMARGADALPAFAQHAVDVVFLRGRSVVEQARPFLAAGAAPLFSLGGRDIEGQPARCAPFADVPTLQEAHAAIAGPMPPSPLAEAWLACATAAQLEFALVLPHLTPAAQVALWRQAGTEASAAPEVQTSARDWGVHALAGAEAAATAGGTRVNATALTAVRQWLRGRFNWQPT